MSRPWNKSLLLSVGAQHVHATLRPSWLRRTGGARARHPVDAPAKAQPMDGAPFGLAIESVLAELGAATSTRQAQLSVAVTDSRVHFDLVSGAYGGYSNRQLQAIANACVAELLGDAALDQLVRWQLQPDLCHLLICAMHREDVSTLVQAAKRHGLRLTSVQPDFCLRWNQHASKLQGGSGVFAVACSEHVIVASATCGAISALSYGPCDLRDPIEPGPLALKSTLDARVDRLLASVGREAGKLTSFVLVTPNPALLALPSRWTLVDSQGEAA